MFSIHLTQISPAIVETLQKLSEISLTTVEHPKIHLVWEIKGWGDHASYDHTNACKKYFLRVQLEILSQTAFLRQGLLDKCLNFMSKSIRTPASARILKLRDSILKEGTGHEAFTKELFDFIEKNEDRFYEAEEEFYVDWYHHFFYIESTRYQEEGEYDRFTIDLKSELITDIKTLQNPNIQLPQRTSFGVQGKECTINVGPYKERTP